jgi:REP-associated tyrosine transposase
MGRLPRAIDGGLIYHALNRGNNRADVFIDDEDREAFLAAQALIQARYPFKLLGYCLMNDHFYRAGTCNAVTALGHAMQGVTMLSI